MNIQKYTKKELEDIVQGIDDLIQNKKTDNTKKKDLESLVGSLPFLLLNDNIFQKNLDVAIFGEKIGIEIPSPEKKKKEDLIGRIISAISKFDKKKIENLNSIIDEIKKKPKETSKNDFFSDWEDAIKKINL